MTKAELKKEVEFLKERVDNLRETIIQLKSKIDNARTILG